MTRDSLTALVALNRFGFGARGGASGDFVNAASDPRGFVKAELNRPNGALLEVPGLQPTPVLAKAIFEYQFEMQQARAAAKAGAASPGEGSPPANPDISKPQRRNPPPPPPRPPRGGGRKGPPRGAGGHPPPPPPGPGEVPPPRHSAKAGATT